MSQSNKKSTKTKENVKQETEYKLSELRKHCRELFGVKPEVFDGAFFDYKKDQVAKSEAENRIKAFLNKEVKN